MKYLVLIQARCGSTRLRNKVLMPLADKPVLLWTVRGIQRSKYVDEIVVVTSMEKDNLQIIKLCAEHNIRIFVGSEADVLDRYYQAAKLFQPEYVIRITGDCPLIDAGLLDLAIEQLEEETDYMGMLSETFADGLDTEIFKFAALKDSWKYAVLKSQREHVTQYIIHHPEIYHLQDFVSPVGNFGEKRWTLDEPEDYELLQHICNYLVTQKEFNYVSVLNYLKEHPELESLNAKFARNEGLKKSLEQDEVLNIEE